MTQAISTGPRFVSLDQFRGYTVAGMLLVNFLGGYHAIPAILKHHNTYCSYADTIMPQFFFAVGFAYRLTFLRRMHQQGAWTAAGHVVKRSLGLILIGVVIYHLDGGAKSWAELQSLGIGGFLASAFQRNLFQALVHIGVTSIWVLPVIATRPMARAGFLAASAVLHLRLSRWFYFDWVWNRPGIDGGPLGFLSWTIPLLVGSLAYDVMVGQNEARRVNRLLVWSLGLMLLGYALTCMSALGSNPATSAVSGPIVTLVEPPFVTPARPESMWSMSQRAGSVSYQTFAAGFSLAVYVLFVLACDLGRWHAGLFRTFGQNALAAYILHELVAGAVKPFVPRDAPVWFVLAGFLLFFGISYLLVRYLEKSAIYIRM